MGADKPVNRRKLTRRCPNCNEFFDCDIVGHGRSKFTCKSCREEAEANVIVPDYTHLGTETR